MARLKVKHGTYANYMALVNASPSQTNADTLYFITDRGLIFKGDTLVTNKITIASSGSGSSEQLTITDNSTASPSVFTVKTSTAIAAIVQTLETALQTHAALNGRGESGTEGEHGYDDGRGHVALSDATDSALGEGRGTAATPLAVSNALAAAKQYADGLLAGLSGAMVFKGVLGSGSHSTVPLPTTGYKAGWTYYVGEAGIYALQTCEVGDIVVAINDYTQGAVQSNDWSVIQKNIDGAVTAANDLANNSLVLGNGNKTVKTLAGTDAKQWLKWTSSGPSWSIPYMYELGSGYLECDTAANTAAKTAVAPSSFRLKMGGIVAVKFSNAVPANATLNISSTGANAIWYRGAEITANVIHAGDTAIMVFEEDTVSKWHVVGINKPVDSSVVQNSKNPVSGGAVYTELAKKQNTLTEGPGIDITEHFVTGTTIIDYTTISVDFGNVEANGDLPVSGGDVYDAINDSIDSALNWGVIPTAQS